MKSIALRAHEAAAYAAGRLTQLRRVVKPQPYFGKPVFIEGATESFYWKSYEFGSPATMAKYHSPYGAPGDRLALREGWADLRGMGFPSSFAYKVDSINPVFGREDADSARCRKDFGVSWRSPVTMPLSAVRWHPVIRAVRLERVQNASNIDFQRLGLVDESYENPNDAWDQFYFRHEVPYRKQFTRDNPRTPWESNPWVWVIDVEGVKS